MPHGNALDHEVSQRPFLLALNPKKPLCIKSNIHLNTKKLGKLLHIIKKLYVINVVSNFFGIKQIFLTYGVYFLEFRVVDEVLFG